jgi:hypothetical protein
MIVRRRVAEPHADGGVTLERTQRVYVDVRSRRYVVEKLFEGRLRVPRILSPGSGPLLFLAFQLLARGEK